MATLATLTLVNPGFETGDLTGWTVSDPSVTAYSATVNFAGDDLPRTGTWAARGGTEATTRLWQDLDVSAYASFVDANSCTLQGFRGYNASFDPQPDGGQLEAVCYDGGGAVLATFSQLGSGGGTPGWLLVDLGSRAVPVGTRRIRLGAANFRLSGLNNDSYWDDFESPTLETTLPLGTTHDLVLNLRGEGALTIAVAAGASPGAPVVIHNLTLVLRGELQLGLGLEKWPRFDCAPPPPKAWPAVTATGASWDRRPPTPPEPCDGGVANDDLDLLSEERLVTLAGDGLKLVS